MEAVKQITDALKTLRENVVQAETAYDVARKHYTAAIAAVVAARRADKPARKKPEPKTSKQIGPRMITTGPSAGRWRNPGSRLSWATQEEADRAAAGSTTAAAGSTTAAAD